MSLVGGVGHGREYVLSHSGLSLCCVTTFALRHIPLMLVTIATQSAVDWSDDCVQTAAEKLKEAMGTHLEVVACSANIILKHAQEAMKHILPQLEGAPSTDI